jgi:hypothetical protein
MAGHVGSGKLPAQQLALHACGTTLLMLSLCTTAHAAGQREQGNREDEEVCTLCHWQGSKVQGLQEHTTPGRHLLSWLCLQKG